RGISRSQPIVGMAPTPSTNGYWLAARDGGIFAYGDAPFRGSGATEGLQAPVVDIAAPPSGAGYWLAQLDGQVSAYGGSDHSHSTGTGPGESGPGPPPGPCAHPPRRRDLV